MNLSRLLWKAANVVGKTSQLLRDASAVATGDPKAMGRRIVNRAISYQARNMYLRGNSRKRK